MTTDSGTWATATDTWRPHNAYYTISVDIRKPVKSISIPLDVRRLREQCDTWDWNESIRKRMR